MDIFDKLANHQTAINNNPSWPVRWTSLWIQDKDSIITLYNYQVSIWLLQIVHTTQTLAHFYKILHMTLNIIKKRPGKSSEGMVGR